MMHTDDLSQRLLRLPLWVGLAKEQQDKIVGILQDATGMKR
jgi:dTDP-4-amino-4,6-dideoxygalactose transaminase